MKQYYLSKNDLRLIKNFANEIGYNKTNTYYCEDINQNITFNQMKNLIEIFNENYEEKLLVDEEILQDKTRKKIIKILEDKDLREVIELFYPENNHTYHKFLLYDKIRASQIFQVFDNIKNKLEHKELPTRTISAKELIVCLKLSDKDKRSPAVKTYLKTYELLFNKNQISKHKNVQKLRKLVNEIFEITLRDNEIKQS